MYFEVENFLLDSVRVHDIGPNRRASLGEVNMGSHHICGIHTQLGFVSIE